ncbi:hypothetical protein OG21DRAFT_1527756, partial [Imleria badia]
SEEQQVALWLNTITDYLHGNGHALSLGEAGPSSRTRETVRRTVRRWSAESATKAQRVGDTELQLKPDVTLVQLDEYDKVPCDGFSWQNIASFLELTSDEFSAQIWLQLVKKAYAIFVAQHSRCFIIALSVANQNLHIHHFDHSGVVHSRGYNIHEHATFLVQVIYTLTMAPLEHISYDPTLSFSTTISCMKCLHTQPQIWINGEQYFIECMLFYNEMICGHAPLCFVVIDPTNKKQYVVKDCWMHSGRVTTEEDMLMRIKPRGLTYRVPVLQVAWTVQILGKVDSTDLHRPTYLFQKGSKSGPPETHIHCCLFLMAVGEPLTHFSCIQELLSVLIDIVDGHKPTQYPDLWALAFPVASYYETPQIPTHFQGFEIIRHTIHLFTKLFVDTWNTLPPNDIIDPTVVDIYLIWPGSLKESEGDVVRKSDGKYAYLHHRCQRLSPYGGQNQHAVSDIIPRSIWNKIMDACWRRIWKRKHPWFDAWRSAESQVITLKLTYEPGFHVREDRPLIE